MTQATDTNEIDSQDNAQHAAFKVLPDSLAAKVFLAFLTTAGIFYINIMPAVVSGLKEGLAFTNQQAGFVSSANLYGASIGALAAVFMVKKINWRNWSYILLFTLLVVDFACIYITSPEMMIGVRGIHGLVGGLLVGIGFAVISRTKEADKTFGYLLFIQWGLGGLGLMYLPGLVPTYGTGAMFVSLITFTLVTLLMLPLLPDYSVGDNTDSAAEKTAKPAIQKLPLCLNLGAIFLFQAANMGLFAYMIGLGKAGGLTIDFMSPSLAAASWIALLGSVLVIVVGTKFGRAVPLFGAILLTAFCSWLLRFNDSASIYLYANIIIGICWAFVLPYLFGICSELDRAGQLAALGGFASKMGLASGPMVAGIFLGNDDYGTVIDIAVIGLMVCAVVSVKPAHMLDNKS